jgi:hemerythrin superfamily protein
MPTASIEKIDRVLQSVEYPADREAILAQARRRRAGQAVRSTLEQLPEGDYQSPANARKQLERVEPSLKRPKSRPRASRAKPPQTTDETEQQQLQLPEPVRQAAETVRVRGGRFLAQAGEQVTTQADRQRGTVAESLMATSRAIRDSGVQLEQSQPPAAGIIGFAATQLEAGAEYLQRKDARQIMTELEEMGRRQPWLVFGVGALAGLIATRLVKSSDMQALTQQVTGGQQQPSVDAIGLLESDHRELRRLLRQGQSAAVDRRAQMLQQLKNKLQSHERMEEEVFYPALQQNPATREIVAANYAEHHAVDEILGEIEATDTADALWTASFSAMKTNLEQHAADEETELFPLVRKAFTAGELRELGTRMSEIKQLASQVAPA